MNNLDLEEQMINPKIYVVLPVHNRVSTTKNFIACLKEQTYQNYHLILVDDGCTDGTVEYVKNEIDHLTVLHGNGNLWWAGSLTKAYRHLAKRDIAHDDIVWTNNDDTLFDPDYFERLINDPALEPEALVISPGHSLTSDFTERGFKVDWPSLRIDRLNEGEEPDAITTRGLYMLYPTYISLGPLHPWLLPHYLSDIEYTIRAKRRGFKLVISSHTHIYVDRSNTGSHKDNSTRFKEYLINHLLSKKSAYNTVYWGNFVLLAAPRQYKLKLFRLVYKRFYYRLTKFIQQTYPPHHSVPGFLKACLKHYLITIGTSGPLALWTTIRREKNIRHE
jgi:GT2 family glycosyltransferase